MHVPLDNQSAPGQLLPFQGKKSNCLWVQTSLQNEFWDPVFQRGLFDVHMMVALNGAERTVSQWWVPLLACLLF
jgi:hypothetical protein